MNKKTGKMLKYGLTNDYMFRRVFEENRKALKGLVASLLSMKPDEIFGLTIRNTVKPGESINYKECRMDIDIQFNDNTYADIEMQVKNHKNWHGRSILYLSREYSSAVKSREDYSDEIRVYQIGILDYNLSRKKKIFYEEYKLQGKNGNEVYTENISIMVMSLKQVENASDEDRRYGRDKWAKLITAKTREEVEMIAKTDSYIEEAAETLLKLQSDYATLKYIQEREDFRQDERKREKKIREQENKIKDQDNKIKDQDKQIQARDKQIQAQDKQIQARDKKIQKQSRQLKQKDIELERYRAKYGELE